MILWVTATTAGREPRNPCGDRAQAAGVILDRLGPTRMQTPELGQKLANRDVDLLWRLRRLETAKRLLPTIGDQRLINRPSLGRCLVFVCRPKLESLTAPR